MELLRTNFTEQNSSGIDDSHPGGEESTHILRNPKVLSRVHNTSTLVPT